LIPVSADTKPLSFLFPHGLLERLEGLHDPSVAAIQIYISYINLLKPAGYAMQNRFNIQQLYALPTLHLCVLYLFENKQRLVSLTA